MNKLKACGAYIFGGSQSLGHLQCGFKINTILEMTEDMIENNSYHFVKNYKDSIKVYRPSEWNNESFLFYTFLSISYKNYKVLPNRFSHFSYIDKYRFLHH